MTSLFYMRLCKEINYYKNILDSLEKVLPIIEETYSIQLKDGIYCIASLYLICEKKIIQEVNILKRKTITLLEEIQTKINLTKSFKINKE